MINSSNNPIRITPKTSDYKVKFSFHGVARRRRAEEYEASWTTLRLIISWREKRGQKGRGEGEGGGMLCLIIIQKVPKINAVK